MNKLRLTNALTLCLGLILSGVPLLSKAAFDLRLYGGGAALGTDDLAGTAVADLTGSSAYPDSPSAVETVSAIAGEAGQILIEITTGNFEYPQTINGFSTGNTGLDNYGGAASGLLYPPATGNYTFYLSSDDASTLSLSSDDKRANLSQIAQELGCCNPLASISSAPVALEAGKAYYIEVLFKEGGGGDYFQVGWSLDGGSVAVIPGGYIQRDVSSYATGINGVPPVDGLIINPSDNSSSSVLNPSVPERGSLNLVVEFDFNGIATIQWQLNSGTGFQNIAGATSPVLAVEGDVANDGNRYRAVVNGTNSAEYVVTINPDIVVPVVRSATHGGNPNGILVTFSEPVSSSTATNLSNYSLDGGNLPAGTTATLSANGLEVRLLGPFNFQIGDQKVLVISGVEDLAATPNPIESSEFTIDYGSGGAVIDTTGLLNYWNFEGTYDDLAGTLPGNASESQDNGTAFSGVSFASGGPAGNYGLFDGTPSEAMVEVPNSPDVLADGEDLSITAWFRVDSFDKSWQALIAHGEGNDWRVHRNGASADTFAFRGGPGEPTGGSAKSPISDGEWHHVAATVTDNGTTNLYLDGELSGTLPAGGSIASNGATRMLIGGNPDTAGGGYRTWNGGIDEVTMWNRELTPDEILTLASTASLAGGSLGPITVSLDPESATDVPEHQSVTLKVETSGSTTGLTFDWYFTPTGGTEASLVPGVTSSTYTFVAIPSRAGSYYAVAKNWFSEDTSATATVSIVPDTTAPDISSLTGSPLNSSVSITFSEPVTSASAGNVANYAVSGLTVTGVTVVNSRLVNVQTSAQAAGQRYTVTVNGVTDLAETPNTLSGVTANFNSFELRSGGLTVLFYEDNGGEIGDFYPEPRGIGEHPSGSKPFGTGVNLPDIRNRLSTVTTYLESPASGDIATNPPGNVVDNYAQIVYGFLVPSETGNYRFGLATDDNGELYLSSDDDPQNAVLIANEPGWNAVREYDNVGNQSEPITLEAGRMYYIEAVNAEGGGGDNLAVAWTFSADGDPDPIANGTRPIPAANLMSFLPVNDDATIVSISPVANATFVDPASSISASIFDGRAQVVDPASVVVRVGNTTVASTAVKTESTTVISATPGFAKGSTIDVVISYNYVGGGSGSITFSFSTSGTPPPPAGAYVSTAGLLNYWNFEGDAEDKAGTLAGNASTVADNGTAGAGVSFAADGPAGQFGLFNGNDENGFVAVADSADVVSTGRTLSISAWFRVDNFDKSWQALLAKGEGTDYRIAREGGNNNLAYNGGNGEPRGGGNINDGRWHHIVTVTEQGVASSLFIDGQLADSRASTGIVDTGTGRLLIGANPGATPSRAWNGAIDEVSMWSRVLTPLEIAVLAQGQPLATVAQNKPSLVPQPYSEAILIDRPIAYYRFEEADGAIAANAGTLGSANNGLWKTGNGPADSIEATASSTSGPLPGNGFIGFGSDNRAAAFTGPVDLLWIDTQGQLLNNLPAFTLEYWVKPSNRVENGWSRVGIVGQNDAVEYGFINTNTIQIWTPGGGALDTTYSFADEEWHHVATVADGTGILNYFDGQLVNRGGSTTTNYGSSTFNVNIGGGGVYDATGNHFDGALDEVAIFNKAISADRVLEHYLAGSQGLYPGLDGGGGDAAITSVSSAGGNISITYTGKLQSAPTVLGPWSDVVGAASPYSEAIASGAKFFRVVP